MAQQRNAYKTDLTLLENCENVIEYYQQRKVLTRAEILHLNLLQSYDQKLYAMVVERNKLVNNLFDLFKYNLSNLEDTKIVTEYLRAINKKLYSVSPQDFPVIFLEPDKLPEELLTLLSLDTDSITEYKGLYQKLVLTVEDLIKHFTKLNQLAINLTQEYINESMLNISDFTLALLDSIELKPTGKTIPKDLCRFALNGLRQYSSQETENHFLRTNQIEAFNLFCRKDSKHEVMEFIRQQTFRELYSTIIQNTKGSQNIGQLISTIEASSLAICTFDINLNRQQLSFFRPV